VPVKWKVAVDPAALEARMVPALKVPISGPYVAHEPL
jgi:hypothetical protein